HLTDALPNSGCSFVLRISSYRNTLERRGYRCEETSRVGQSPQVVTTTADNDGLTSVPREDCPLAWRMLLRWRCRDALSAWRPGLPVRLAASVSLSRRAGRILQ